jgi:hypothetical protein
MHVHDAGLYTQSDNTSEQLWCVLLLLRMHKKVHGASLITGKLLFVRCMMCHATTKVKHSCCMKRSNKQVLEAVAACPGSRLRHPPARAEAGASVAAG